MLAGAFLQLPHGLGLFSNHDRRGCKVLERRSGDRGLISHLSSRALRQDGWSLHVSHKMCRPICYVPRRPNGLVCRSFALPNPANKIPLLKETAVALTRSCNALREGPLVIQLFPAFGVIAFAVWGIGPLLRHSRTLFLQRNDSNWKKSTTYHVLTSYLQPLLLWTGATLVCKVLDPMVLPSEASQVVKQRLLFFVRSLSTVLALAYCLSRLIQQAQKFFLEKNDSSDTRNMGFQFAGKALYTAVWIAAISLFMELLGFSTQKWITAGGLGTVLLTLAGREILTNFLSSVMIHATRPFVANEWIQTKIEGYDVSGTVEHVGWWSPTIIRGEDREAVHIPNHQFTVNVVRNLSQKSHWRIKTHLAISHLDVNKINNIVADMRKVLAKNPQVEHKRLHRRVFLENINPENQALLILISCFVKTSHFEEYLCVKEAILLDLLRVISHHKARLATPIRTVQKIYGDANIENVPFAETIITRAGPSTERPLLLIEPSKKINGNDKAKPRPPPNDEQTAKGTAASEAKLRPPPNDEQAAKGTAASEAKPRPPPNDEQAAKATAASEAKATTVSEATSVNSDLLQKAKSGDSLSKNNKIDTSTTSTLNSPPKAQHEALATSTSGIKVGDEKPPVSDDEKHSTRQKVHSTHDTEWPSQATRPAMEGNIVLGVALDGSKRTLPIEEGIMATTAPAEAKELAVSRSGNRPSSSASDKKETQIPASSPSAVAADLQDQEN